MNWYPLPNWTFRRCSVETRDYWNPFPCFHHAMHAYIFMIFLWIHVVTYTKYNYKLTCFFHHVHYHAWNGHCQFIHGMSHAWHLPMFTIISQTALQSWAGIGPILKFYWPIIRYNIVPRCFAHGPWIGPILAIFKLANIGPLMAQYRDQYWANV